MLSLALACFLASAAPDDEDAGPKNEWSPRVKAILEKPDRVEMLLLVSELIDSPVEGPRIPKPGQRLHGVEILGRGKLENGAWKPVFKALTEALPKKDAPPRNDPSELVHQYPPAYAFRVVNGDDVVTLHIHNSMLIVRRNDEEKAYLGLYQELNEVLQAAAKAAKLPEPDREPIPAAYREVLENAETLELLSLNSNPEPSATKLFHGNEILGRTKLGKEQRRKVLTAMSEATKKAGLGGAGCFIPRHGLRATHKGITVGLVICFECGKIDLYYGESDQYHTLVSNTPAKLFNEILTEAKIPLPDQPDESPDPKK